MHHALEDVILCCTVWKHLVKGEAHVLHATRIAGPHSDCFALHLKRRAGRVDTLAQIHGRRRAKAQQHTASLSLTLWCNALLSPVGPDRIRLRCHRHNFQKVTLPLRELFGFRFPSKTNKQHSVLPLFTPPGCWRVDQERKL